jgi:hypothetical protein
MKDLDVISSQMLQKELAFKEIEKCNNISAKYGLVLTREDIQVLVEERFESLKKYGRMEFGSGIMHKIIFEFSDSPYIWQDNYAEMLSELQDIFYYFKNESLDEFTDDDLIRFMRISFDNECQGSVEYLRETRLEDICRSIRYGEEAYKFLDSYDDDRE